jgi:TolA-binding protein
MRKALFDEISGVDANLTMIGISTGSYLDKGKLTIDETKLTVDSAVTLLSSMRNATYPDADKLHYKNGHTLYSEKKYQDAITELGKALVFNPSDVDAIYFTARSYDRLGDKENAAKYYNIVINQYPNSNRIPDAKDFLKQVQKP